MKLTVVLIGFSALVAVAWCEVCTTNSNCVATTCAAGSTVICQHPDGAGIVEDAGLCTCEDSDSGCFVKEDCYGADTNLNCPDAARHCYDNACICDRFPIGRR